MTLVNGTEGINQVLEYLVAAENEIVSVFIGFAELAASINTLTSTLRNYTQSKVVFNVYDGQTGDISKFRHLDFVSLVQTLGVSDAQEVSTYNYTNSESIVFHFFDAHSAINQANLISEKGEVKSVKNFEYFGSSSAEHIFVFSSLSAPYFIDFIKSNSIKNVGILFIQIFKPFNSTALLQTLPESSKTLSFFDNVNSSSLLSDFIGNLLVNGNIDSIQKFSSLISFHLATVDYSNISGIVKSALANVSSQKPINNLVLGTKTSTQEVEKQISKIESIYLGILDEVFNNKINFLNEKVNSSPEFAFGRYLAQSENRKLLLSKVKNTLDSTSPELNQLLSDWSLAAKSFTSVQTNTFDKTQELLETLHKAQSPLLDLEESFSLNSNWIIGSDAWSYDLGNSGLHNVIKSNKNVNMLIIDSQPHSAIATHKKDIGLYAMNYENVYVASVAVYASYTQLLQALLEAEKFDGPSVVLAYLPYYKDDDTALTVLQETKKAVDSGYWPLYRYNPTEEGEAAFKLDSPRIKKALQDFLDRENHLTLLAKSNPKFAATLTQSYGKDVRDKQKRNAKNALSALLDGLSGPPITILYASDGGNATNVAKRLANRAKARGLKSLVLAMDDYPIEDLSNEENLVLITSTAGQGELPQNGRAFWDSIKSSTDIDLASVRFSVFGLGDSAYWPRKEDKHYYNKPAKDLFNKLKLLGGSVLIDIGLGDDQDADGYQQGYNEWEALLWKELGVDNVAAADEPPPITNEDIKINSDYLRGTIAEGLQDDSTGAISAHDQQLTKFHGIYMQDDRDIRDQRKAEGLEPAYSFMVRVRLPGCVATPQQWLKMDQLADERGNGTMKITTRGTFQLHGVIKKDLKPAIRGMNSALIDTVAACGDVDRNVVAAALPTNKKIHDEIIQISHKISEHLLPQTTAYHEIWLQGPDESDKGDYQSIFENRQEGPKKKKTLVSSSGLVDHEPLYGPTYLPRKFKINIAVPPYNDVDVFGHDIGLVAIVEDNELKGFNVFIGGGMGTTHNNKKTYPRTGSLQGFVAKDKIVEVCEKVMLVQRDFGDRKNRKHARLKYTVDDLGNDVYREKVEELLGYKFEQERPFKFDHNTDLFGEWIRDEAGYNHFTTFVENGRVEDTAELQFKTGFRELAQFLDGTEGEFRLTANQHILVSNISDEILPSVKEIMAKYKMDNTAFSGLRLSSAACVAFPTCGLAMAESERFLPVLITRLEDVLEEAGLRHDSIVMRMTGCPNGCARPWLAEIAFVGKAPNTYNIMLGGGHMGQRLNKLWKSNVKDDDILSIVGPLFRQYALEREQGEWFGDFVIRKGIIKETTEGKNFWEGVADDA